MTLFSLQDASPARGRDVRFTQEETHMVSTAFAALPMRRDSVQVKVTYGVIYPLCVVAQGFSRLLAKIPHDEAEPRPSHRSWLDEARADASIATSYALMAWTMLQSSGRHHRPERPS